MSTPSNSGSGTHVPTLRELLPRDVFARIHEEAQQTRRCDVHWCRYLVTTCRMEELCSTLRTWWGDRYPRKHYAELEVVTGVIERFRRQQGSSFYMLFWPDSRAESARVYEQLMDYAETDFARMRTG